MEVQGLRYVKRECCCGRRLQIRLLDVVCAPGTLRCRADLLNCARLLQQRGHGLAKVIGS